MPELMISPTPTPPNAAGNVNAPNQTEVARRLGDGENAKNPAATESPFASVLKSQVDKQTSGADAASKAATASESTQIDSADNPTNPAISLDFAALLPLLNINVAPPVSTPAAPLAATQSDTTNDEETSQPGLLPVGESAPVQLVAVLAAPAPVVAAPASHKPSAAPSVTAEPVPSAPAAKPGSAGPTPGKIVLEAAINADAGNNGNERPNMDAPANEFHALIDRATTMAPTNATSQASGTSSSPALRIDTPVGKAGWQEEIGQKLTWMVGNGRQQADLVLTPPQLGRVEVSLTMNGDQASAIFTSSNPAVREALESSLHRLREVLAEAGVSLGQTQVGSQSPNQSQRRDDADFGVKDGLRYASTIPLPETKASARHSGGHSMIDIFA